MYVETPRMVIRDFMLEDVQDLYEILGDGETMKFCEAAYDYTGTKAFLAAFCMERKGAVAAVHRQSGKVIGYILFCHQGEGVYEIGWLFNRKYWRQGYAFESCRAVIDYGFREQNVHKFFAETLDPVKSPALMKKLGMRLEGTQRSHVKDPQGNWADLFLYGLLKEDWNSPG